MISNKSKKNRLFKVVILGSGNIGCDILVKTKLSKILNCEIIIGRRQDSPGLKFAKDLGVKISYCGIEEIINKPEGYDLVFDCTSALSHNKHYYILKELGIKVIDLTPANLGEYCIPAVNLHDCVRQDNISMVTCGGQAAIPLIYALRQNNIINYLEVVSSISAKSAGMATRQNIDEYICVTEGAIKKFSGCNNVKTILNINPADPCVNMQTTIYAKIKDPDMLGIIANVLNMEKTVQTYIPGYSLLCEPLYDLDRVIVMVSVIGSGHYLPKYAGNLDIITSSAIKVAENIMLNS